MNKLLQEVLYTGTCDPIKSMKVYFTTNLCLHCCSVLCQCKNPPICIGNLDSNELTNINVLCQLQKYNNIMRLLPLMYIYETSDILFFIKNLKNPTNNFNINTYISFSVGNTRSYGVKLRHNASSTNKECSTELVAYGTHYQLLI